MKNQKKKYLFFLVLFLNVGFFGFREILWAVGPAIVINEINPNTADEKEEFVELFNVSEELIDISGWAIKDSTATASHKTIFPEGTMLSPGGYFYVKKNLYLNNDDDVVHLLDETGLEKDQRAYEKAVRGKSYSFDGKIWQWTTPTMGAQNEFEAEGPSEGADGPVIAEREVYLNEILPNPSGKEQEYIELFNNSSSSVDLEGWILRDGSKTGKYVFTKDSVIKGDNWLLVYKEKFKFALNDSGAETVRLLDPNEKEVSAVAYSSAKDGVSYNWSGAKWRWSQHLTPGAENVFDGEPNFSIKKDKEIFKNFPAKFEVKVKNYKKGKTKITWDFGDRHKSYKQKTTHKYEKKGKYTASVKIFNGSEEVTKTFQVKVKDFPKYDVEIIGVNPNPDGKDADLETITIKNNSKKKVDLQNWSIATGDKKLTNHPIALKTILKPKETLKITRALSKFTLNNKKAKVELRYPTGKVASKMNYDKKTAPIAEGEILEKTKLGWVWKNTVPVVDVPQSPDVPQETNLLAVAPEIDQNLETPQILGESDEKTTEASVLPVEHWVGEEMFIGGQSKRKAPKDFKIVLASFAYAPFLN